MIPVSCDDDDDDGDDDDDDDDDLWSMIYDLWRSVMMIHDAANDADLWWSSVIVVYKCPSKNTTPDLSFSPRHGSPKALLQA